MALLITLLLVGLAAAAASAVRERARAARGKVAALQRLELAQAAIRLAEATLRSDDAATDSADEDWATLGGAGAEATALEPGSFRVQIVDAGSRVNINTATKAMLLHLPGVEDSLADAILDWREAGDAPRPAGAKTDYYQALPDPYLPRGGAFETVAELLLVRDVTPVLLYGPPQAAGAGDAATNALPLSELVTVLSEEPNVSADGQPRRNLNTVSAAELMTLSAGSLTQEQADAIVEYRQQNRQFASVGDLLAVPGIGQAQVRALVDRLSVTEGTTVQGRINVNTASAQVLEAVPGMTAEAAEAIVTDRDGDHGAFRGIGELLDAQYLSAEAFRQAAGSLGTRSSLFLVRALARVPGSPAVTAVEALVQRGEGSTQVVRWQQVERAPGWIAWGWTRQISDPETGEAVSW